MSVTMAIEWSTRRLSVATCGLENAPVESVLDVDRFHGPDAVALIEDHMRRHAILPSSLRSLIIGRGPGNFSGIRLAFAWAAGWSAPGGVILHAYSSARVMAEVLMQDVSSFWVLGDARRGYWWGCQVLDGVIGPWTLESPDAWRGKIGSDPVFSSEPGRLTDLPGLQTAFPSALNLIQTTLSTEQTEPLYLHPAV